MMDYEAIKRFYAEKLIEDLQGHGRMESAFFHTCGYVFDKGMAEMQDRVDQVYEERNRCVALIASMALALGWAAGRAKTAIPGWDEEWHNCVYVDLPAGQVSWHYHDREAHLFAHLPEYTGTWDGHNTGEKYSRVAAQAAADNGAPLRAVLQNLAASEAHVAKLRVNLASAVLAFTDDEAAASRVLHPTGREEG